MDMEAYIAILSLLLGFFLNRISEHFTRNIKLNQKKSRALYHSFKVLLSIKRLNDSQNQYFNTLKQWRSTLESMKRGFQDKKGLPQLVTSKTFIEFVGLTPSIEVQQGAYTAAIADLSSTFKEYKTALYELNDILPLTSVLFAESIERIFSIELYSKNLNLLSLGFLKQMDKAFTPKRRQKGATGITSILNIIDTASDNINAIRRIPTEFISDLQKMTAKQARSIGISIGLITYLKVTWNIPRL